MLLTTAQTAMTRMSWSLWITLRAAGVVPTWFHVDSFRVNTSKNAIRTITTTSREFDFNDLHNELVSDRVVGISNQQMGAFQRSMPNGAGGPNSFFTLKVGTGMALGVPTTVSVVCAGPKGCNVRTVTTLEK